LSATTKTFLEIKKVVDHDCGNYRIGEIDFIPRNEVREYVLKHGQFAVDELHRAFFQMMEAAYMAMREKHQHEQVGQCSAGA